MHQDPDNCCDVCALPKVSLNNRLHELTIMVNAIDEIGTKGEKKLAQYVRCGNEAWIKSLANLSASKAYGRSPPNLTLEWWHQFARQCSVAGYLNRKVDYGTFQGRQAGVFSYYEVAEKRKDAIANNKEVLLPPIPNQSEFYLAALKSVKREKETEKKNMLVVAVTHYR